MKKKILTTILSIGLVITSSGWAYDRNQKDILNEVAIEQEVDLKNKSTEIANLDVVIANMDDSLKSKEMVIEKQLTQINKQGRKIGNLEKKVSTLKENVKEANFNEKLKGSDDSSYQKGDIGISRKSSNVLYSLNVSASAYVALCDTGCTGITATGKDVRNTIYADGMRIIATDPSVIPLYSIVKIEGFSGVFIALDTGGAIKGNKIDILVSNVEEAKVFGRQNLKIEVLRKGKKK